MISVKLNGEPAELECHTLADAMKSWQYDREQCAVAVNGEFIPRSVYSELTLNEGDAVEVVAAVGGG